MTPVFLFTDIALWLLILSAGLCALSATRNPMFRAKWQHILSRPIAVLAGVVFLSFVVIALLDSIHGIWPNTPLGRPESLLDRWVGQHVVPSETTYSKPFAVRQLSLDTQRDASGEWIQIQPPLPHAGQHLRDESERLHDIVVKTGQGAVYGLCAGVLLVLGLGLSERVLYRGKAPIARRTLALSVMAFAMTIGIIAALSAHYHILGTDKVGEDVFWQAIKSIRTGLVIGVLTTAILLPFATLLGLAAGYFRGWVDDGIQFLYTTLSAIPGVLLIAAMALMLQVYMSNNFASFDSALERADARLFMICVLLGITSWTGLCRILRGEAMKLRKMEFVDAARTLGVGHFGILRTHLLPNVMPIILISLTLDFSGFVLAEAVLSYVGVGVDPETYSWGSMINSARLELGREPVIWWSLSAAFLFMFLLVLSANILADAFRDAFDPRRA